MRVSQYILATLKETPKNCEAISHQLMLRAGLIRQVSSGLYAWLPTGLRVLKKIKNLVREEMNKSGAIEMLMPIVQPAKLWKQSGRWSEYGTELLRFKNRNHQDFILSPTHEEMISNLICKEIMLSQKFPLNVYQIYTKYRDEARPRFGIIRTREFIMKDGYSFHTDQQSLQNTYDNMYNVYYTIFKRVGLNFCIVQANPGKIGGILSHEFQAYSKYGEDNNEIATFDSMINNDTSLYDNNIAINSPVFNVEYTPETSIHTVPTESIKSIEAPYITSIPELINQFNLSIQQVAKTIIVRNRKKSTHTTDASILIGLVIRADHQLSYEKIKMLSEISIPLSFVNFEEINMITGAQPNLLGPINLSIPLIVDYNVAIMHNFVAGSNITGKYFFGVNWFRDFPLFKTADLYESIDDTNKIMFKQKTKSFRNRSEIGHIFQLGQKYSNIIQNHIQKSHKSTQVIKMGCYGIGISRMVAIIIEQNYDKNGIIWPDLIAPFKLIILPINMYRSVTVKNTTETIYNQLLSSIIGVDILLDDREVHPGTMFHDADLIGIPHILIISERHLDNQEVEYKYRRRTRTIKKIKLHLLMQYLFETIS